MFEQLVGKLPVGIGIVDEQFNVVYLNDFFLDRLPIVQRLIDIAKYKKYLAELKTISEQIAKDNGVTTDVIASKKQLNQLLKWYWFPVDETRVQGLKPDLLSTWRAPLFRPHVARLLGDEPTQ